MKIMKITAYMVCSWCKGLYQPHVHVAREENSGLQYLESIFY